MKLNDEVGNRVVELIKKGHSQRSVCVCLGIGLAKVKAYALHYGGEDMSIKLKKNGVASTRNMRARLGYKDYGKI